MFSQSVFIRGFIIIIIIFVFIQGCVALPNDNSSIETKVEFKGLEFQKLNTYDLVTIADCKFMTKIGQPKLPIKTVFIALPPQAKVIDVEILCTDKEEIEGKYEIYPSQPPRSTMSNFRLDSLVNKSVYNSRNAYPGKLLAYKGEGYLRGYKIIAINIYPVQYVPADGKLVFYKSIIFKVVYADGTACVIEGKTNFNELVKRIVSNPEDIDKFYSCEMPKSLKLKPHAEAKYVIITSDALKDAFQPLADWKTKKGVPAEIVTISWIEDNYLGIDTQEKIRNFIKDAWLNRGTEWVLLGGDTDIVPFRGGYGNVSGAAALADEYEEDTNIPADLYYSDLDGNWNADNDSIYGEVNDEVDLFPDVFVGRAPVDTVEETRIFVNKTLMYEKNPPVDYQLNLTFLAEKLWSNPITWGGDAKDVIDSYIPSQFTLTKKYERDDNASKAIAIGEMNMGPHIVNHEGHGNYNGFGVNGWISSSDADNLINNPRNFILYTISCMSNGFDHDSVSEHYMNNPDGGTVAYIGNSRYGWFEPGYPGGGPSDLYDQQFFKSLFDCDVYNIGEVFAYSKMMYISSSQEDGNGMRWLQYAINLLGDPELPIWTASPRRLNVTNTTTSYDGGIQITIEVKIGGNPIENALVCLQNSEGYVYGYTNAEGQKTFNIPTTEKINATVTAHNYLPHEGVIAVNNLATVFDTNSPANPYPSISGTHNGTITPNQTIAVHKLYTYPCIGTGGHTEYARIWNNSGLDVNASWDGYIGDWHNISFNESFKLVINETYNYTIRTGSYPQIHHTKEWKAEGGVGIINCTSFIDANGKRYNNWIPAIRLFL